MRTVNRLRPAIMLLVCAGCAGPLYNVAPVPGHMPSENTAAEMPNGITVEACVVSEIQSQDQFDANLSLAGLIAVEARLINKSNQPVTPAKLKPELRSSTGARYKTLSASAALKRIMEFYGNTIYFTESYRRTRTAFEAVALQLDKPIDPGADTHGFLFFKAKSPSSGLAGLILTLNQGGSPITLKLN